MFEDLQLDFRELVEEAPDVVELFYPDGRYRYVNPEFERITGIPRESVVGKTKAEIGMPEEIVTLWEEAFDQVRKKHEPVELDMCWSTRSEAQYFHAKLVPVPLKGPELRWMIAIVADVTEKRAQEERLHLAMRAGRMGAWEWDLKNNRLFFSVELLELHRIPPEKFRETLEDFIQGVHPEDRERVLNEITRSLECGQAEMKFEYCLNLPGDRRWVQARGRIIRDDKGRVNRVLGVCVEITALKRAEDNRLAREAAERANQAKDQFIAVLSHELRTPLTPVLAELSVLEKMEQNNKEIRDAVESMRHNVEMEARLIDDLLDLTRITRGKLQLRMEVVDVHSVLHRAIAVWRDAFHQKRLRLQLDLSARDHFARGDASRLQQVFWNLLSNAIKFTPEEGLISIRTISNDRDRIFIEITDSGIGISVDQLPRLFDAFQQGDEVVTRRFGGLGLGLAICRAVVELHGGAITAQSAGIGKGSRFIVELQTAAAPTAPATNAPLAPHHHHVKARILLVEDHESTARVMQRLLSRDGHHVTVATTVAQALAYARDLPFDLIISDIGLPDGSGLDLMREFRTFSRARGISLSGYGMETDIQASRDAGFDLHLIKPVSIPHLEESIDKVLSHAAHRT